MENINFDAEFEERWQYLIANSKSPESGFTTMHLDVAKLWARLCFNLGIALGATQARNKVREDSLNTDKV